MFFLLPVFLAAGLLLPGYFLAGGGSGGPWRSLSRCPLFHAVFWLGIRPVSITLWTVLPFVLAVAGAAAWINTKTINHKTTPPVPAKPARWAAEERLLIVITAPVTALFARCAGA